MISVVSYEPKDLLQFWSLKVICLGRTFKHRIMKHILVAAFNIQILLTFAELIELHVQLVMHNVKP